MMRNSVRNVGERKKTPPPAETRAEIYYYKKQIDAHTQMVIVLQDGEEIEGTIEWYDKEALKINRKDAPNIMLLRHNIKYMYKAEEREKLKSAKTETQETKAEAKEAKETKETKKNSKKAE
ncbi:MAG: Hfq-like protein [Pyrinomonadaceae bacterium]